jgi:SAM-dependent methyltransferase
MVEHDSGYAFGDNTTAGDRLALLAEVFEPTSERLLARAATRGVGVAVDLGSGPGHTTALLARVTGASRTIGLDSSPSFVERARRRWPDDLEFRLHDVTRTPFPTPAIDLLFARFVLAHLASPLERLADWCAQLRPGGRFATIETECIETDVETFAAYEETARSMVASRHADLQVGRLIKDLPPPPSTSILHSELVAVRPPTATVARLYAMNLATWRNDPFVTDTVPVHQIETIAHGLAQLLDSDETEQLTFYNRQVVYRRDE